MTALLKTERLEAFYGASQVLHGIDLELKRGEQIALLGRNGMGKTTLLRSLMGLVDDCRGSISLSGQTMMRAEPEAIARAGVITRFWSPDALPAGRMPGVTSVIEAPTRERSAAASSAEQTSPSTPISRACAARRAASEETPSAYPAASRSGSS